MLSRTRGGIEISFLERLKISRDEAFRLLVRGLGGRRVCTRDVPYSRSSPSSGPTGNHLVSIQSAMSRTVVCSSLSTILPNRLFRLRHEFRSIMQKKLTISIEILLGNNRAGRDPFKFYPQSPRFKELFSTYANTKEGFEMRSLCSRQNPSTYIV